MVDLRWGLLGTGRINRAIIPAVRESGVAVIKAVASRDAVRADAYAAEWGIPRSFGSYEELLASDDVDIIYNALPNALHAPWTIAALRAGKHVLVEKPFTVSSVDADAVVAAARAADRVVVDGTMVRYHPRVHAIKRAMDAGEIGTPLFIRSAFTLPLGRPDNARWDSALGGGALWDVGWYPVSVARYLAGALPVSVEGAACWTASGVDEHFTGTLYFPGSLTAQITVSFAAQYVMDLEMIGSEGLLRFALPFRPDEPGARLELVRGSETHEIPISSNPGRYRAEVDEMHERIATGRGPTIPTEETRDVIAIIEDLYRAAKKRTAG